MSFSTWHFEDNLTILKHIINLYSKKIIEEDTFEDLQDTYEFSKNHDYKKEKDDYDLNM